MGTVNPRPSQRRPAPWRPHFGSSSPVSVAASVRGQTSARRSWPRVEMRQELPVSIPSRFLAVRKLTSASGSPRLKSSTVDGGTTVGRLASVPIAVACSFPPVSNIDELRNKVQPTWFETTSDCSDTSAAKTAPILFKGEGDAPMKICVQGEDGGFALRDG